jgi:hypothetical protein
MSNARLGSWDQDNSIEKISKEKLQTPIFNQLNIEGLNWKKKDKKNNLSQPGPTC